MLGEIHLAFVTGIALFDAHHVETFLFQSAKDFNGRHGNETVASAFVGLDGEDARGDLSHFVFRHTARDIEPGGGSINLVSDFGFPSAGPWP